MHSRFLVFSIALHGAAILGAGAWAGSHAVPRRLVTVRVLPPAPALETTSPAPTERPVAEQELPLPTADPELATAPDDFRDLEPTPTPTPTPAGEPWTSPRITEAACQRIRPLEPDVVPPPPPPPILATPPAPRVQAHVLDGHNEPPAYPRRARRLEQEGTVVVRIFVATDGTVRAVELADSSGHALLDAAAREAALGWRFAPARLDDIAVEDVVEQEFVFRLR